MSSSYMNMYCLLEHKRTQYCKLSLCNFTNICQTEPKPFALTGVGLVVGETVMVLGLFSNIIHSFWQMLQTEMLHLSGTHYPIDKNIFAADKIEDFWFHLLFI